jgi:hypothetical protein
MRRAVLFSLLFLLFSASVFAADDAKWADVAAALGRPGALQPDGVYKAGFPRTDLAVTADGVAIKAPLALGSWVAFLDDGTHVMAMGDLVLLSGEVAAVVETLEKGGVDVSAIHNHLIGESPRVMYVHFSGHGDAVALARTLHAALATTKTPIAPPPAPAAPPPALALPTADMDRILGRSGKAVGGVYQFGVPRAEAIHEAGMTIPPSMGMSTAINFQPLGNDRAATTGDFVLLAAEVNPVIRVLHAGGIAVTALHSHMLQEEPRLFFMHFWGVGDAKALSTTLRQALDLCHLRQP